MEIYNNKKYETEQAEQDETMSEVMNMMQENRHCHRVSQLITQVIGLDNVMTDVAKASRDTTAELDARMLVMEVENEILRENAVLGGNKVDRAAKKSGNKTNEGSASDPWAMGPMKTMRREPTPGPSGDFSKHKKVDYTSEGIAP